MCPSDLATKDPCGESVGKKEGKETQAVFHYVGVRLGKGAGEIGSHSNHIFGSAIHLLRSW